MRGLERHDDYGRRPSLRLPLSDARGRLSEMMLFVLIASAGEVHLDLAQSLRKLYRHG